jgi:hypothetical protein
MLSAKNLVMLMLMLSFSLSSFARNRCRTHDDCVGNPHGTFCLSRHCSLLPKIEDNGEIAHLLQGKADAEIVNQTLADARDPEAILSVVDGQSDGVEDFYKLDIEDQRIVIKKLIESYRYNESSYRQH